MEMTDRVAVLHRDIIQTAKINTEMYCRDLSILSTKKEPTLAGEENRRIRPEASESFTYFSIARVSGADKEKRHPLEGVVPGSRSIAQSYERSEGWEQARVLLNKVTWPRLW